MSDQAVFEATWTTALAALLAVGVWGTYLEGIIGILYPLSITALATLMLGLTVALRRHSHKLDIDGGA